MSAPVKRFRKRGGAKKKKKNQIPAPDPTPNPFEREPTSYDISGFRPSSTVDPSLLSYLTELKRDLQALDPDESIAKAYASNPTDDEPPPSVLLSRNALAYLLPHIPTLLRDPSSTLLLESLLGVVADPILAARALDSVLSIGSSRVAQLITAGAASRVIERILTEMEAEQEVEEVRKTVNSLATCVAEWTGGDTEHVMWNSGGSHVFRRVVAFLGGVPVDEPREAKLDDTRNGKIVRYVDEMRRDVPEEWSKALVAVVKRLKEEVPEDKLKEMAWVVAPCAAMQGLISAVECWGAESARQLAEVMLKGRVRDLVRDRCGGRLVERVVLCCGVELVMDEIGGQLAELAADGRANFCVQRILLAVKGRGGVMSVWDQLEERVGDLLSFGRGREGVVLALMRVTEVEGDENCKKRASRCLARACGGAGENSKILALILMLGSVEMCERWRTAVQGLGKEGLGMIGGGRDALRVPREVPPIGLLGGLIVRCMLRYSGGAGQAVRDCLAGLADVHMLALMGSATGSRVLEQWIDVERQGKAGKKYVGKILNMICKMNGGGGVLGVARNSYGAKVLLKCMGVAGAVQRKMVMDGLAKNIKKLEEVACGEMLLRKLRVEQYMKRGEEWEEIESARETRERLFKAILEPGEEDGEMEVTGNRNKRSSKGLRPLRKRARTEAHESVEAGSDRILNSLMNKGFADGRGMIGSDHRGVERESGGNYACNDGLGSVLGAIKEAAGPEKKKRKKKAKKKEVAVLI
eukprot:GFKZ01006360.1.p1 GENE.GFKZ01006360.1~~GFKZ01006360.1.p1  ORF type:complete len:753 (+),score=143.14 GFKZ01006360.1:234-2492(+)